ncbi:DUF922 domain-containing protein [Hyphobacterium sp. CCMP332]|nr:DUF922 domain-containing protein [Hyphobacterium sp. CCMP332]
MFISISHSVNAQEKIRWNDSINLSWKDFKARAVKSSPMAAETYTRTEFGMSFQEGEFSWKVDCYFSPQNSWVKAELKSDDLLSHEQLHFAIAELNARKIRKKMAELELNSMKDSKKLQKTFEEGLKELAETQKLYDKETDHGLNDIPQKDWEQKVMSTLEKYKSFSSSKYNFDK